MVLEQLHNPNRVMNVVGCISRKGTNLVKIIEHERGLEMAAGKSPYHVAVIFSDNPRSNANEIGSRFAIPVFTYDLEAFCARRGVDIKNMDARAEYEERCVNVLDQFDVNAAAYAGYMRKATDVLTNSFLGINVHPADLSIKRQDGKPKYRGDHAVLDALNAGEKQIRSTTHIVEKDVDCGGILMISAPVNVKYNPAELSTPGKEVTASRYQDKLKEVGDWVIFPRTLQYIAEGRYATDENKNLYFDGKPIPDGVRLE